jgi:ADP-ribose pyrophosphatase
MPKKQPPISQLRRWKKLGSRTVADLRIFSIRAERMVSPRTHQPHEFFVIDCVDWVNVIALTPDQQVVMIEQYRHGSRSIELEIPGGMMEPTDRSAVVAGTRELREETGYSGRKPRIIGQVLPNPAIMSNTCYTVLVENCRCIHSVEFDHGEDMVTRLVPVAELPRLVSSGRIRHSLVAVALYHFELWQREH